MPPSPPRCPADTSTEVGVSDKIGGASLAVVGRLFTLLEAEEVDVAAAPLVVMARTPLFSPAKCGSGGDEGAANAGTAVQVAVSAAFFVIVVVSDFTVAA